MSNVPPWWRVYFEPGEKWDAGDLPDVLSEFEKKPPNRQLLSPIVASFIAGLMQAGGGMGYLMVSTDPPVYTPFTEIRCDLETADFVVRQISDAWAVVRGRETVLYVLGLRAVLLLKISGPYLRGFKRDAAEAIIAYGYKLTSVEPSQIAQNHGLGLRSTTIEMDGKKIRKIIFSEKVSGPRKSSA